MSRNINDINEDISEAETVINDWSKKLDKLNYELSDAKAKKTLKHGDIVECSPYGKRVILMSKGFLCAYDSDGVEQASHPQRLVDTGEYVIIGNIFDNLERF